MIQNLLCKKQLFTNFRTLWYFCKNKDYFANKKAKQAEKVSLAFRQDPSKLKQFHINFKSLSPNFFTKHLPIKQCQKIIMANKQANSIQNSYITLDIPLGNDEEIRSTVVRLKSNQVRMGRILQCMDSIAGIVGYRHCFGSLTTLNPFILVTGSVDSINLFEPIYIDKDITMEGYVNFVGKTSMQIEINLFQENKLKSNALFVMVSRRAQNPLKGFPCPKLNIDSLEAAEIEKARKRMVEGEENSMRRKIQMSESYQFTPPKPQDIKIIHDIFLKTAELSKQAYQIEDSVVKNIRLMHAQERNIHNKIFGGFLMREMVETGWVVATRFATNEKIQIQDITNVYFRQPVEIGCQLKVRGRVSYTKGKIMIVSLQALTYTYDPQPQQKLCCLMHIFFKCEEEQKMVFPRSYENGIHYLTSRNLYKKAFLE